jgi:hypothetical protein
MRNAGEGAGSAGTLSHPRHSVSPRIPRTRSVVAHGVGQLKALLEQRGRFSGPLISETDGLPSASAYRHRFGSLFRAYQLAGYTPKGNFGFLEVNRQLRAFYPQSWGRWSIRSPAPARASTAILKPTCSS